MVSEEVNIDGLGRGRMRASFRRLHLWLVKVILAAEEEVSLGFEPVV
jgi:hypothetical protein